MTTARRTVAASGRHCAILDGERQLFDAESLADPVVSRRARRARQPGQGAGRRLDATTHPQWGAGAEALVLDHSRARVADGGDPHGVRALVIQASIRYVLRVRVRDQLRRPALLRAQREHPGCLQEHGVQIMSAHYVLDPPAPVPRERWLEPPAARPPAPGKDSGGPLPGRSRRDEALRRTASRGGS